MYQKKNKILIVDDSEMNRMILADMLSDQYEILEAENGLQAVEVLHDRGTEISLVLLDIVMPEMDGFEVLAMMNRYHWIEEIPVIIISAENSNSVVEHAYELGATDYINRPFDEIIVCRRVINTIMLYSKQKQLVSLVADQMYESEKSNTLMVSILSHIVEFRNGESGMHVLHIGTMTEMLLRRLQEKTDRYHLDGAKIAMIAKAAAFHDIGKISIKEEILNKPGRLTKDEFEIMKTHSAVGAEMLENLPLHKNEPLVKVAYEICRWHHERYDGSGYPDGLKGEEIPISAQAVSIADAYDALISERVYKKAFPHDVAMKMILNGECGSFHPLLLECLSDIQGQIEEELTINSLSKVSEKEMHNVVQQLLSHKELATSNRTLSMLEEERIKGLFFASLASEIQFEYTKIPSMVTISDWGAEQLNLPRVIMNPEKNEQLCSILSLEEMHHLDKKLKKATISNPIVESELTVHINGEARPYRIICRAMWSHGDGKGYSSVIGKLVDIQSEEAELQRVKRIASLDPVTNLLNAPSAKKEILTMLSAHPDQEYAMMIFDLDLFKSINYERGHVFGDRVLKYLADRMMQSIRKDDIVARIGGDEFLLFVQYDNIAEKVVQEFFNSMTEVYDGFRLTGSMGIAKTSDVGRNYEQLYHCADVALFEAKRHGVGNYVFYSERCINDVPTNISDIDSQNA